MTICPTASHESRDAVLELNQLGGQLTTDGYSLHQVGVNCDAQIHELLAHIKEISQGHESPLVITSTISEIEATMQQAYDKMHKAGHI